MPSCGPVAAPPGSVPAPLASSAPDFVFPGLGTLGALGPQESLLFLRPRSAASPAASVCPTRFPHRPPGGSGQPFQGPGQGPRVLGP